jgi:hypothetical protein
MQHHLTRDHYWAALKLPPVMLDTLMALIENEIITVDYLTNVTLHGHYAIHRLRRVLADECPATGITSARAVGYWMTPEQKEELAAYVAAKLAANRAPLLAE